MSKCCECEYYERFCLYSPDTKMYKRKCYLDSILKKLNRSPKYYFQQENIFYQKSFCLLGELVHGVAEKTKIHKQNYISDFNDGFLNPYWEYMNINRWKALRNNSKLEYCSEWIEYLIERNNNTIDKKTLLNLARILKIIIDVVLDTGRDKEYVYCVGCGATINNNTQHNRLYCDVCIAEKKKKIYCCIDCGEEFTAKEHNSRQVRCKSCQAEHEKELARQRAKRYREKQKSNGFKEKN